VRLSLLFLSHFFLFRSLPHATCVPLVCSSGAAALVGSRSFSLHCIGFFFRSSNSSSLVAIERSCAARAPASNSLTVALRTSQAVEPLKQF
jgi:hypothetical protein